MKGNYKWFRLVKIERKVIASERFVRKIKMVLIKLEIYLRKEEIILKVKFLTVCI